MRIANRLIATALGLALLLLAIIVVAEIVLGLLGRPPWLSDRAAIDATLSTVTWSDPGVLLVSIVILLVGIALLIVQLEPRPPTRLALREERQDRSVSIERRSLEQRLAGAASSHPDVTGSSARISRRHATLQATTLRDSDRRQVSDGILDAAASQLEALGLSRRPRLQVHARPGQERTR